MHDSIKSVLGTDAKAPDEYAKEDCVCSTLNAFDVCDLSCVVGGYFRDQHVRPFAS